MAALVNALMSRLRVASTAEFAELNLPAFGDLVASLGLIEAQSIDAYEHVLKEVCKRAMRETGAAEKSLSVLRWSFANCSRIGHMEHRCFAPVAKAMYVANIGKREWTLDELTAIIVVQFSATPCSSEFIHNCMLQICNLFCADEGPAAVEWDRLATLTRIVMTTWSVTPSDKRNTFVRAEAIHAALRKVLRLLSRYNELELRSRSTGIRTNTRHVLNNSVSVSTLACCLAAVDVATFAHLAGNVELTADAVATADRCLQHFLASAEIDLRAVDTLIRRIEWNARYISYSDSRIFKPLVRFAAPLIRASLQGERKTMLVTPVLAVVVRELCKRADADDVNEQRTYQSMATDILRSTVRSCKNRNRLPLPSNRLKFNGVEAETGVVSTRSVLNIGSLCEVVDDKSVVAEFEALTKSPTSKLGSCLKLASHEARRIGIQVRQLALRQLAAGPAPVSSTALDEFLNDSVETAVLQLVALVVSFANADLHRSVQPQSPDAEKSLPRTLRVLSLAQAAWPELGAVMRAHQLLAPHVLNGIFDNSGDRTLVFPLLELASQLERRNEERTRIVNKMVACALKCKLPANSAVRASHLVKALCVFTETKLFDTRLLSCFSDVMSQPYIAGDRGIFALDDANVDHNDSLKNGFTASMYGRMFRDAASVLENLGPHLRHCKEARLCAERLCQLCGAVLQKLSVDTASLAQLADHRKALHFVFNAVFAFGCAVCVHPPPRTSQESLHRSARECCNRIMKELEATSSPDEVAASCRNTLFELHSATSHLFRQSTSKTSKSASGVTDAALRGLKHLAPYLQLVVDRKAQLMQNHSARVASDASLRDYRTVSFCLVDCVAMTMMHHQRSIRYLSSTNILAQKPTVRDLTPSLLQGFVDALIEAAQRQQLAAIAAVTSSAECGKERCEGAVADVSTHQHAHQRVHAGIRALELSCHLGFDARQREELLQSLLDMTSHLNYQQLSSLEDVLGKGEILFV